MVDAILQAEVAGRGGRGGRGHNNNNNNNRGDVTDRYYTPQERAQLTSEQQTKVREMRSNRDKRRGVQLVETRNVRPKSDDISAITNSTSGQTQATSNASSSSIAAVSTQRSRNF